MAVSAMRKDDRTPVTVTDIDDRPLDFSCGKKLANNRGVVAGNQVLHERFLSAANICLKSS